MALGKISGHMLTPNLLRHNEDLSIETNLMYFSVSDLDPANYKIGIGTDSPSYLFDVSGTARATNFKTSNVDIGNINLTNNTITSIGNLTLSAVSNNIVLSSNLTSNYKVLIGSQATTTRFPNSKVVISETVAGIQQNESHNIGLIAEGTGHLTDTSIYGVGLYGIGYTNAATRSSGVIGEGHVSASSDTGSAIGVRGYSNDIHAGGMNIGLYGDATNGLSNYALYLNNGGVYNNYALTWTMNGNLTFSGAYSVTIPTLALTNALPVTSGGTGVTSSTGSGSVVLSSSPTLTTPSLGVATATSINKVTITAPATSASLTIADGSTLATSGANSLTLTTTAATNVTFPTSGTLVNSTVSTLSSLSSVGTITTGTWSGSFGVVSGANLTNITAGNLTGTISSTVLGNSSVYIGTTGVALNRTSENLVLSGVTFGTTSVSTSFTLPAGDNASRPVAQVGNIRYNTTYNYYEGHDGSSWGKLGNITVGDGLTATPIKTSNYSVTPSQVVRTDSSAGSFDILLPASPDDGTVIGVFDVTNSLVSHGVYVKPAPGDTIEGDSTSLLLDVSHAYATFMYVLATNNWKLQNTPTLLDNVGIPIASTSALGLVKVDGTTITINGSGVITSVGGGGSTLTTGYETQFLLMGA